MTSKTLKINRDEAIAAKRAVQDALDRVNRVREHLLPGALNIDLDLAARSLVKGITALRDADKEGNDGASKRDFE